MIARTTSRSPRTTLLFTLLFVAAGCTEETDPGEDAGAPADAGARPDSGPSADAGTGSDAGPSSDAGVMAGLEIAGAWIDGFGGHHDITDTRWVMGGESGGFTIVSYDNAARVAIAENDAGNSFNPGLWSRFDWAIVGGATFFCQTAFDAASEAAALATGAADSGDPANTGCGGFPWTSIQRRLAIEGEFVDSFGGAHEISSARWETAGIGGFEIASYDNDAMTIIAQNDATNSFNPQLWSRFDWTWSGIELFFCQSVFDAASRGDAEMAEAPSADDPETTGCGGFAWTELSPGIGIAGSYTDDFGGTHTFTSTSWVNGDDVYAILQFSNEESFFVAQNASTNAFNPDLFSRVDWTTSAGALLYCQTAFAEIDEASAASAPRGDDSDPENTGCGGGFPWTALTTD